MLVTNIHSHTYKHHIHICVSPFKIPHNGYYVIIKENNFLHIKHLIREIWIEGMKVPIVYIVYSWDDGGLNQGHLWISVIFGCHNFGGCIWYLVGSWLLLIILKYTGQAPTLNNELLVQNVSRALLEKLIGDSLYTTELLRFIFNNQSSPGFCASC